MVRTTHAISTPGSLRPQELRLSDGGRTAGGSGAHASGAHQAEHRGLALDHLPDHRPIAVRVENAGALRHLTPHREPHRHAYHELIWTRTGTGRQLIDGQAHTLRGSTVTLVGRGQVHVFERGFGLTGAIVRFDDALITSASGAQALLTRQEARAPSTVVPERDVARVDALVRLLEAECHGADGDPGGGSVEVQSHLLSSLLLWVSRWTESAGAAGPPPRDVQLHHSFLMLLERDFETHHSASHYSDALHVSPPVLSRSLVRVCGRTTKELITARVMLEAARLLRFSDQSVSQVAFQIGFTDPFYFSRAFKQTYGVAPLAYRAGEAPSGVRQAPSRQQMGRKVQLSVT